MASMLATAGQMGKGRARALAARGTRRSSEQDSTAPGPLACLVRPGRSGGPSRAVHDVEVGWVKLVIVGLGAWGCCALERLVDAMGDERPAAVRRVTVHVVEPGIPGPGVYDVDQPSYLLLNTPAGQISLYPWPERSERPAYAVSFLEWIEAQGYRWVGDACHIDPSGRPISEHDFVPRSLLGRYLTWFYQALVRAAPPGLRILHHPHVAEDVVATADGRERVLLDDGSTILADHVVLTTGHTANLPAPATDGAIDLVRPYPVQGYADRPITGLSVGVAGMGLVGIDVVMALTLGRGGSFTPAERGRVRYRRSGREPVVQLFSRGGAPYLAKPVAAIDETDDYDLGICTPDALDQLQGGGATGRPRVELDLRREVLPLVFAEMQLRYYEQAARLSHGPAAAGRVRSALIEGHRSGTFPEKIERHAAVHGVFDPAAYLFANEVRSYPSAKDFEDRFYAAVDADLTEALVEGGASPVKAGLEVLRFVRDPLRHVIEWRGLTLSSYLDFRANIAHQINRLNAGPPAERSAQLLALIDAGVVQVRTGQQPVLEATGEGLRLRSRHLEREAIIPLGLCIEGHLEDPALERSATRLLSRLAERGRLCQLHYGDVDVGSVELDEDSHPIDRSGSLQARLWVFGALTEGVRYFTHYLPSPKSRLRVFLDVEACIDKILA
jgi:uncharacterized NAD(P)/FAD-binding protein YdhS